MSSTLPRQGRRETTGQDSGAPGADGAPAAQSPAAGPIESGAAGAARGIKKRWRRRMSPGTTEMAASTPGLAPLVREILAGRGVVDGAAAKTFLEPSLKDLHDPSCIPDLDKAARRLLDALRAHEPIAIYGDYDVDGVTATAILFHTLQALHPGADIRTYVPHRLEEGYGLNSEAIHELALAGARVIVSVDCGITAVEPARQARADQVDLIITDHHNPPASMEGLPDAFAIVHPRRPDSTYPFGDLCGAGVAFKLAWRLATLSTGSERAAPEVRDLLIQLLALTSLGIIADVVPLVGENRVIARHGLSRIKHSPLVGLRALVEASGLAGENVNAEQVGFQLAPRLNACGRMGHARDAVELFTTADPERAAEIAAMLSKQNDARRRTEKIIFDQAVELAEQSGMTSPDRRVIVLAHEDWHPGVVGIVCSRLVERFGRPAILMQRREGMCHGSGRSIDGYSLHAGLEACKTHLASFGGHDMAAGLKLREQDLDAFVAALVENANARIAPEDLVVTLDYDCDASLRQVDGMCVTQLDRLAPFGRENPPVRLRLRGLKVALPARVFGKENKHLSVMAVDPTSPGAAPLRLFGWGWAEHLNCFRIGATFDAVVVPRLNVWQGRTSVECEMIDAAV